MSSSCDATDPVSVSPTCELDHVIDRSNSIVRVIGHPNEIGDLTGQPHELVIAVVMHVIPHDVSLEIPSVFCEDQDVVHYLVGKFSDHRQPLGTSSPIDRPWRNHNTRLAPGRFSGRENEGHPDRAGERLDIDPWPWKVRRRIDLGL